MPAASTTQAGAARPPAIAPEDVRVVRRADKAGVAAITFHGGGEPALARRLLEAIGATPVTVFAIGQWLDANPDLASQLAGRPELELENHTFTHPVLPDLAPAGIYREIAEGRRAVTAALGRPDLYFRPSGTTEADATIVAGAAAAGYGTIVLYDVDSADYTGVDAARVVDNVRAALTPGSIVSLHFGYPATIEAFPQVLQVLHERGLAPVTVRGLLG